VTTSNVGWLEAARLVVPHMSQRPLHEGGELRLMTRTSFGKGLLELTPHCGESDAHAIGGSLQTLTMGDSYRCLCFTIRQFESSP
jgi:hypothetical protein